MQMFGLGSANWGNGVLELADIPEALNGVLLIDEA